MPTRRLPKTVAARRLVAAALAGGVVSAPALGADIQGHSATYRVTVEKPPPDVAVAGQVSVSLSKTCQGWTYSSALVYGIERNPKNRRDPDEPLSNKADTYQERLNFTEKLDGTSLQYTARYDRNGHGEDARGTVTLGADGSGTMDVKSDRLPRKAELPAETRLPITLRTALIDVMNREDKPKGAVSARTIELGRFYRGIDISFAPSSPLPPPPKPSKGELPRITSPLLKGRAWTMKQSSLALSEWMESTFELYESGVVSRFTFKREGIIWRADIKELTAFTSPSCGK